MSLKFVKYLKRVIYILLVIYCGYWLLQVTTCCSFHAPTESMTPTILPGDYGIVNKWKMGARIFDISKAIDGQKTKIHRLPGYGKVEHNDIIVFNYPLIGKDTVGMNMRKYYCKRVVAIPGDTLEIRNCIYSVKGFDENLGYRPAQTGLANWLSHIDNPQEHICFNAWPFDTIMGWTIQNFGPLLLPKKGTKIKITRENTILYGKYIAWEQQCSQPVWHDGHAWIDNIPFNEYCFEENYYFAAGDKVENSADSRYWGLLPESMIVGVTNFIWDSKDPETGSRRWNRIFTSLTNNNSL